MTEPSGCLRNPIRVSSRPGWITSQGYNPTRISLRLSDAYMVGNLAIIGSDNGLSPVRYQAII